MYMAHRLRGASSVGRQGGSSEGLWGNAGLPGRGLSRTGWSWGLLQMRHPRPTAGDSAGHVSATCSSG